MTGKNILLIDDDADDQLIFLDALKEIAPATSCYAVNNGIEAFIYLEKKVPLPAFIFLDLNLPLMNGFEFLEFIKKDNRNKKISVIIYTTSNNPTDQKRATALGAEFFFTKTSDFRQLKCVLLNILNADFSKWQNALPAHSA